MQGENKGSIPLASIIGAARVAPISLSVSGAARTSAYLPRNCCLPRGTHCGQTRKLVSRAMTTSATVSNRASRAMILGATVILGAVGAALIFAPAEIASALGAANAPSVALLLQLYGAALFGLAMTGWMIKDAVVGGIFGRSYVVGNAAHAFVGAMALIRSAVSPGATPLLLVLTAIYSLLAVLFLYLMFMATPGA